MAPTLPSSLSPHVCILSSPDVHELFESSGLPPIAQTLQSFVPLPQVTTRTTSLTSVSHNSFALRFSDLVEIEAASHEDEEHRAARTMDWVSARVGHRAIDWVQMLEAQAASGKESAWKDKAPWWEELKRCIEGDHIPNSDEGWNHPVALILAVTTLAVNPLQALQDLNSRAFDFPPWVDTTHMRYYLILHPANSPLADPIAEALFNAVKKQYGPAQLPFSPLALPTDPITRLQCPVPPLAPRLPLPPSVATDTPPLAPRPTPAALAPPHTPRMVMSPVPRSPGPSMLATGQRQDASAAAPAGHFVRLTEGDIQQTGKFVREFVVMSLVPWMEKCVMDWNENFSSSRRLPSRLFSSTRRLFGTSAASAASTPASPAHGSNPSISSMPSRFSHAPSGSISSIASVSSIGTASGGTITQQRRLAEFATILGDYKLAIAVWENLRKEGRGGSDILPLLLSSSPALALHAAHALSTLRSQTHSHQPVRAPGQAQIRAISYAVRWAIGIDKNDFISPALEGERWLVQAAGGAEEPPAAIMLSYAAYLSEKKGARRRSALWFLYAADRLEKGGIKPLAMHFFRRAQELYLARRPKELSPSFWDSEGVDPDSWPGFESVLPGIEHELGRLVYTMGDTEGAVRYFIGLLRRPSVSSEIPHDQVQVGSDGLIEAEISPDKVFLEDFRVALKHFKDTKGDRWEGVSLTLPVTFCQAKQTRVRFPGDTFEGDQTEWDMREEDWRKFWASRGKEKLERNSKAAVDENFWVDVVMRNPLNVDVTLSGLSVTVSEASAENAETFKDEVEIEIIDDITLGARETRTIPVSVKCKRRASLLITHVNYDFLSLLPVTESLAVRGQRLHDTPQQRQSKAYAPDIVIRVEVEEAVQRLHATFIDDGHLVLAHGEHKHLRLWISNTGSRSIGELWMVTGRQDEIWINAKDSSHAGPSQGLSQPSEILQLSNSISPQTPYQVPLANLHGASELAPGESLQLTVLLHASYVAEQDLSLLFVFREANGSPFHCTRLLRHYEVRPIAKVAVSSRPSGSLSHFFLLDIDVENILESDSVQITQVTTVSPIWSCRPLGRSHIDTISPHQIARLELGVSPWSERSRSEDTMQFIVRKLGDVLQGNQPEPTDPPPLDLLCGHVSAVDNIYSLTTPFLQHFIHSGRRNHCVHSAASSHPYIPADTHQHIFPLYHPWSVDVVLFWDIPMEGRSGHILIPGLTIGASHAPLNELIDAAESAKAKRSMYAETHHERQEILRAVRESEWNAEMDPVVVTLLAPGTIEHDFSEGPCNVAVSFVLRNFSSTNPCRVVLKLSSDLVSPLTLELLPPRYAGRLTYRAVLQPFESVTFPAKVWTARPGAFAVEGWTVETEVGELASPPHGDAESAAVKAADPWRSRHFRYVQGSRPEDRCCIIVSDTERQTQYI